ncbi:MAG: DinB family protein [Terriglobales bacterium]
MTSAAAPTRAELAETASLLERSRDELLDFCRRLPATDWNRSDGAGRWTVAQILDHLVIIEKRSVPVLEAMIQAGPDPDWAAKTLHKDAILARAEVVEKPVVAPAPLHPSLTPEPERLLTEFAAARQATLGLLARPGLELKQYVRTHPAFGDVNLLQNLRLLAFHTRRHLSQMRGCTEAESHATPASGQALVHGAEASWAKSR